ncbi:unnamed protein product [Amoebophrya sp. A25]|nr:unnamed protein product [Amoebophrya sp. A25]|eukprot:GSA25T00021140001.1
MGFLVRRLLIKGSLSLSREDYAEWVPTKSIQGESNGKMCNYSLGNLDGEKTSVNLVLACWCWEQYSVFVLGADGHGGASSSVFLERKRRERPKQGTEQPEESKKESQEEKAQLQAENKKSEKDRRRKEKAAKKRQAANRTAEMLALLRPLDLYFNSNFEPLSVCCFSTSRCSIAHFIKHCSLRFKVY